MNCAQLESWLSADQDGELDGRRGRIVREHLASCPACRALQEDWRALAREVRAELTPREAPAGLHARVMQHLPARTPTWRARAGTGRLQSRLAFSLALAGAAAAWLLLAPRLRPPAPAHQFHRPPAAMAWGPALALTPGPSPKDWGRGDGDRRRPSIPPPPVFGGGTGGEGHRAHSRLAHFLARRPHDLRGRGHYRFRPRRRGDPRRVASNRAAKWRRAPAGLRLVSGPRAGSRQQEEPVSGPPVAIVDYVLPERQPLAVPAGQADFVLNAAEAAPATGAEVDL